MSRSNCEWGPWRHVSSRWERSCLFHNRLDDVAKHHWEAMPDSVADPVTGHVTKVFPPATAAQDGRRTERRQ